MKDLHKESFFGKDIFQALQIYLVIMLAALCSECVYFMNTNRLSDTLRNVSTFQKPVWYLIVLSRENTRTRTEYSI